MKFIYFFSLISFCGVISSCLASQDARGEVSGRTVHFTFSSLESKFAVFFKADKNIAQDFECISIKHLKDNVDIKSEELKIKKFSILDELELSWIAEKELMYLRILMTTPDGIRHEDRLFFQSNEYIKRVSIEIGVDDRAKYSTKLKGEPEVVGYK